MASAKIISLKTRPLQISHLCFSTEGIIDDMSVQVGISVNGFDFDSFYQTLSTGPTVPGDPSRLQYDFAAIDGAVGNTLIGYLRAEPRAIALTKAINLRQNAYNAKYSNIPAVVAQAYNLFDPASLASNLGRLGTLASLSQQQADGLSTAYQTDFRTGVIRTTSSALNSTTTSRENSSETGHINQESLSSKDSGFTTLQSLPEAGGVPPIEVPQNYGLDYGTDYGVAAGTSDAITETEATATENQSIVNTDYGYRMPYIESQAMNERAQISLNNQIYAEYVRTLGLAGLEITLQNELNSIDAEVYRLQVAYLDTILLAPFKGWITGVFKYAGDYVRAGEPVARIENNSTVYLQLKLVYRGMIANGATITVITRLYDSGTATNFVGEVLLARGNQGGDDHWDVTAVCKNVDASGNLILPFGYVFDFDNTTVDIS